MRGGGRARVRLCVSGEGVGCVYVGGGEIAPHSYLELCTRSPTILLYNSELKSCVKVEVAVGLISLRFLWT